MAKQRANVPKFGNWENENSVPYTIYFDEARKNKGGKMINPNDPQENPEMFRAMDPSPPVPAPAPPKPKARPEEPIRRGAVRPTPEHRAIREEADYRQFSNSPARSVNESSYGGRGQRPARSARPSIGSEQSFDLPPAHPYYQEKDMGRGNASPAWEERKNDNGYGNPGMSRLRPSTRGRDENPDKGAGGAVPIFGQWNGDNSKDPGNYTLVFDDVRNAKKNRPGNPTGTPSHPAYTPAGNPKGTPKHPAYSPTRNPKGTPSHPAYTPTGNPKGTPNHPAYAPHNQHFTKPKPKPKVRRFLCF